MFIDTDRYGKDEIEENNFINFREGIPGLETYKRFAILQFDGSYPIIWLQSTEDKSICLPVIDSFLVLPDYSFDISDEEVRQLSLAGPEDLKIISVLVIPEIIERMTVNLAAPIVINTKNSSAMQVILNNGEYNVRFPIFQDVMRLVKEDKADAGTI